MNPQKKIALRQPIEAACATEIAVNTLAAGGYAPPPVPKIGDHVEGEGIYIGEYRPKGLSNTFNVFAAPTDLIGGSGGVVAFRYREAVKRLTTLKDWYGHDGESYDDSEALHDALLSGAYKGGWVIPPLEILRGIDAQGNPVQADHLVGCWKDRDVRASAIAKGLWSCTKLPGYDEPLAGETVMWVVQSGGGMIGPGVGERLPCRPVRLVPKGPR